MNNYKFSVTFLFGLFMIGIILFVVFFSSIHFNPIQRKYKPLKRLVFSITPQGWAFFTRNPREAQTIIYTIKGNTLSLVNHKHASSNYFMGLRRTATVIMSEMQAIRTQISDSSFTKTEWNYQSNITGEIPKQSIEINNPIANPILCGEYVLVFQEPIPWAYSKSISTIKMPAMVTRIKIKCNE